MKKPIHIVLNFSDGVLTALRCFALMEAIKDYFFETLNSADRIDMTILQKNKVRDKLDTALINSVARENRNFGIAKDITYSDYIYFKNNVRL